MPSDALEIVGKMSEYVRVADSGSEIRHRFCANCGTQLFANAPARQQYTVVRAGALDDPSSILPAMNIWTSSAPEWANIDLALECVEKQPVAPQLAKPNS